jgi:CheY-like chemotaxis protein
MNITTTRPQSTERIFPLAGRETILVVDDQPTLCEVAEILLRRCGYRVLTACSGAQAKEVLRQNPDVSLLLTDIEMPDMSGDELAEWLRKVNGRSAVIFMSGNPMHRRRLEGYPFIEKPFVHLDLLLKTIREALDQERAASEATAVAA